MQTKYRPSRPDHRSTLLLAAAALWLGWSSPLTAADPPPPPDDDKPKNLQVLPKDISHDELIQVMRGFCLALNVRCEYCHVDEADGPGIEDDKASDAKRTKKVAREMIKMTQRINNELLAAVPERHQPPIQVRCVTCHHGLDEPETITDKLEDVMEEAGVDSAVATYRHLREDGLRGRFDFGEQPLNDFVRALSMEGKHDAAFAFFNLSRELNPSSRMLPGLEADLYAAKGDKAKAIELLEKIVAADPKNRRAAGRLQELKGGK